MGKNCAAATSKAFPLRYLVHQSQSVPK